MNREIAHYRVYACKVCLRRSYIDHPACECGELGTVEVITDYPAEPWRECWVLPPLEHDPR